MQYLSCSKKWDYYRHILPLVLTHDTIQYGQLFFPKTISAWNGLAFAEAPSSTVFRSNFLNN